MNATTLIEPSASDGAPDTSSSASRLLDQLQGGLPPLLSVVPQAGPPVFAYAGFGLVLLLLLVPPLTLLATVMAVALIVATALAVFVALIVAIVEAPFLLARRLRGHRFSLPVPHLRTVKVRRV